MKIKAISNQIKIELIKKGYSLTVLSDVLKTDLSYLSLIVNGKRTPSPKLAKRIADTLEVDLTDIFIIEVKEEVK